MDDDLEQIENNIPNLIGSVKVEKVGQEQIHGLLFGDKLSWQAIIYDLINTEQLDPWDINISLLSSKFLDKVKLLEEANFFVSSKVLLAASLLLRIKSEILLNRDIQSLDDILFGKKEEKKPYVQERIELDEDIPSLVVRTPLPRFKKVTLDELMKALGQAITTETRRIKKVVLARQQEYETSLSIPKQRVNIQDRIREVYSKLEEVFENREDKFAFSDLSGESDEERIATFVPLLHLDNQQKVWLEQEKHLDEIWILLKHLYEKKNAPELKQLKKEVEEELEKLRKENKLKDRREFNKINKKNDELDDEEEDSEDDSEEREEKDTKDN